MSRAPVVIRIALALVLVAGVGRALAAPDSTVVKAPAAPAPAAAPAVAPVPKPAAPRRIAPALVASARPGTMCGVCHSDVRVQEHVGVHEAEGVTCVACHGGDANATTVEAAHRAPYRGKIQRKDIPALCGSCHSDVTKMRADRLPTDQLSLYRTSKHGQRLAQGDDHVAVCTDCHGVHEVRTTADPRSMVFARNIPATCGKCHGDHKLMGSYGHKDDALADYKRSVHGKALLEGGNDAAPNCTSCHGSHGATPPGADDVGKTCGQCHSKVRAAYAAGPHKKEMDAAGQPECVACHGVHDTKPVTIAMLDTACVGCHRAGTKELQLAGTFKNMYTQAAHDVDDAERLVDHASRIPLYVDDYKSRLAEAHTALMEAMPMMHSLDVAQVEPLTRKARSIAGEVSGEIQKKLAGRVWRYVGLVLMWFYLGLTAALVYRARKRALAKGVA